MDEFAQFLNFIQTALDRIEEEYFLTQYHQFHVLRYRLRNLGYYNGQTFVRHSERGFAYELYFHLRVLINCYRRNQVFFPDYYLQGEIKKMNVDEVAEIFGYQGLGGAFIPDLLFHIPSQDANAFVIEIKAQPVLSDIEVTRDLDKLGKFLTRFNYRKAAFIAVNIPREELLQIFLRKQEQIQEFFPNRLSDCNIITKESFHHASQIETLEELIG